MFSDVYSFLDKKTRILLLNTSKPSFAYLVDILEKSKYEVLSLAEVVLLLNSSKKEFALIKDFVMRNFRSTENTLNHIAPIYLSSYCADSCNYCNFSSTKTGVKRSRISLDDLDEELDFVLSKGNGVIEFTLASDYKFNPDKLAKYISKTKNILANVAGSGVLLCSDYFSKNDYLLLKESGLDGVVQWDETLDEIIYSHWHGTKTKKANFKKRMNTHDVVIQAGLNVATGFLFGLSSFKYDILMQIEKSRYLKAEYGVKPLTFGTPRIKSFEKSFPNVVSNMEYELALMVYKIAEPTVSRWLQTRETPKLNFRNVLDGDMYTFECGDVKPGGYKVNKNLSSSEAGQFRVTEMKKQEFESKLHKMGFSVDYSWM